VIKQLILNNLVLVDSCEVHFGPAFNAVTGETGAGKTALIEAIGLALGQRADSSLIRKGSAKAYVEISFDIQQLAHVKQILEDSGLTADDEDELIIRREISKEGKNRTFINCRGAPLPLLQKIGAALIDLISQHAHQTLQTTDSQRALVDLFGSLHSELGSYQRAYAHERECRKAVDALQQLASHRERDEDTWRFQLGEIEAIDLKKGEEEEAFAKYQKLAHAQELTDKIDGMIHNLTEGQAAILPQVSKCIKTCDTLISYDKSLSNVSALLHEAHVALSETLRTLQSCSQNNESDPNTFAYLENRLSAIARLKRKYGQTCEEVEAYSQKITGELQRLENLTEEISCAERSLASAQLDANQKATLLTSKRIIAAEILQKTLTAELQHLNMSGAALTIKISPQPRSINGDDAVQFWLRANVGEHPGRIQEHSSGGELSRLLFAIKIALAEKNNTPTLIFDEIDANVGGKTASIIGEKLKSLGKHRQVLCITHFPQVASKADEHFSVQKIEADNRTLTQIKPLCKKGREVELLRMMGET
jgi:DNA repair protein RecN (Recombination protein N)